MLCDWAGLVYSCHSNLEWWCDWEELRREEEEKESPLYSCSITGGTPGHWKTPWKFGEKRKKRITDPG